MQALQLDRAELEAGARRILYLLDVVQEQMTEIRHAADGLIDQLTTDDERGGNPDD